MTVGDRENPYLGEILLKLSLLESVLSSCPTISLSLSLFMDMEVLIA